MDSNIDYPFRRGRSSDNTHWYSSTYWRSNNNKINSSRPSQESRAEKGSDIQFGGYLLRPYNESNSRLKFIDSSLQTMNSRESIKRLADCIEELANNKRLKKDDKSKDPFNSPNSLIKDFRLTTNSGCNSPEGLFCKECNIRCQSSLDYSTHLNGKRHLEKSNRLDLLLRQSKEPIVGLNHIKEIRRDFFNCDLCDCSQMSVHNSYQHIIGNRHHRNFAIFQKESEDRRKKCKEREKRHSPRDDLQERDQSRTTRRCASNATEITSSRSKDKDKDRDRVHKQSESDLEKFDSLTKTIDNFKAIREICDQMIGHFSQKQKSINMSPKNRSSTGKTFECLASKIKRENPENHS